MHLLILAKSPLPGVAKTRLIPRFGPEGAAALAAASLQDTLDAARASGADRIVVAFDGDPAGTVPSDLEVIPQVDGPFDARLAAAWATAGTPGIQIGMDTPQLTSRDIDDALDRLANGPHDAVLGPASDGGWWAIGFRRPADGAFDGVPMSSPATGRRQLQRVRSLGFSVGLLPIVRDVDEPDDVAEVAAAAPTTRFAEVAAELLARVRVPDAGR